MGKITDRELILIILLFISMAVWATLWLTQGAR